MSTASRLRSFVALADTGSVRAAARALVVTESSVSAAVSALAAEVGVPLLVRNGRGVRLTPAGERYAEYARRILGLHAEATVAAHAAAHPDRGMIRIAAVTTAGEHVLPALLASFRAAHRGVSLSLDVASRAGLWPMLAHHEVDLVIAGRPPDDPAFRARAVSPNTLVAVGAPTERSAFRADRATWLLREPGSGVRATTTALLSEFDAPPPQMTLGSHGAVVEAAAVGLGVTLVSRQAVHAHLRDGTLVELPVPGTPLQRPWHAVTGADPTPSTELMVRHLLEHEELGWTEPVPRTPAKPRPRQQQ